MLTFVYHRRRVVETSFIPANKILVIDDMPVNIKLLVEVLKKEYEVTYSDNGKDGIELAEKTPPDLIVLDIMMPEMDGFEVCDALKKNPRTQDIPIIFITALADSDQKAKGFEKGAVDYITKPFNPAEVLSRVKIHLELQNQRKLVEQYAEQLEEAVYKLELAKVDAEKASASKTNFLSNMSHELRTPLNGIVGFCELIQNSSSLSRINDYSGLIISESEVLIDLINDLLDISKIEAGKLELEYLPFDLEHVVSGIAPFMRLKAEQKGLDFRIAIEPETPLRLVGDPMRLRQIIVNLSGNAVKYTEKGEVNVHIKSIEETAENVKLYFEIKDTGIGIPKEKQKDIFDRFVQADQSTTRKYGGTGLGTAITKQLVELMKGDIGMESEPGKGSLFWFTVTFDKRYGVLQEKQDALEDKIDPVDAMQMGSSGKVLLVEDYPTNQLIASNHLTNAGYDVELATNGLEAVKLCEKMSFDLILMDVQMPEMNGYEATRKIRNGKTPNKDVSIVGLTGNAYKHDGDACLNAGMNDVITKPFRKKAFLSAVRKWVKKNKA
jgi:signal transduction histidine kinase